MPDYSRGCNVLVRENGEDDMGDEFEAFHALDQEALADRMAAMLPEIREKLGLQPEKLAEKTGMGAEKLRQVETGQSTLKWSEFMSILFVLWNDEAGRRIVDSMGLFPDALKKAMSVNRNAHTPDTGSDPGRTA